MRNSLAHFLQRFHFERAAREKKKRLPIYCLGSCVRDCVLFGLFFFALLVDWMCVSTFLLDEFFFEIIVIAAAAAVAVVVAVVVVIITPQSFVVCMINCSFVANVFFFNFWYVFRY